MEVDIEELKKFLEAKVNALRKEIEYYEYLLSILEAGVPKVVGKKASVDYIKSSTGEVIGEIYFTPPVVRLLIRKWKQSPAYLNAIQRLLDSERSGSKIEYEIITDNNNIKEININNVTDEVLYLKIRAGLVTILERMSRRG
jgi:hypothetical protein